MSSYTIEGVDVSFPFQEAYATQVELMTRVISTLNRARTSVGNCHALLESPTGTGKTISMLCSILAWRSEKYPSGQAPKLFYALRTHSQIKQAVKEYRKTNQKFPMTCLSARKHCCVNPDVCNQEDVDEHCRLLINVTGGPGCAYLSNTKVLIQQMKSMNLHMSHDIEDIKSMVPVYPGCPYYATRMLVKDADVIFCPYSYILNPAGLEEYLKGAIIVFDEAHNFESCARDAGSFDVDEPTLNGLEHQLRGMDKPEINKPLLDLIEGLKNFITRNKNCITKHDSGPYLNSWSGNQASPKLMQCGITRESFQLSLKKAREAIKAPTKPNESTLTARDVIKLEGMLNTFEYFFKSGHMKDYHMCLQSHGDNPVTRTCTLSLWCLKPAVVFENLVQNSLSIILTSGTLSPMNSFSSELGINFGTKFEGEHVIGANQVWAGAISRGVSNGTLNASYKNYKNNSFQDELGETLEKICNVVPNGSLVFFPSYYLMGELCSRWRASGQWNRLNLNRTTFTEPRGTTSMDDFGSTLKHYYESVSGQGKATFLAVCRGKVAEGIDFSDGGARAVIIVGIPYLFTKDIKIQLKKSYNDEY